MNTENPVKGEPAVAEEKWHGTSGGYTNHSCRCDACKKAWATMVKDMRLRRKSAPTPDHVHGTENGYGNYGCRCDDCRTAWSTACRIRRQKKADKQ